MNNLNPVSLLQHNNSSICKDDEKEINRNKQNDNNLFRETFCFNKKLVTFVKTNKNKFKFKSQSVKTNII